MSDVQLLEILRASLCEHLLYKLTCFLYIFLCWAISELFVFLNVICVLSPGSINVWLLS